MYKRALEAYESILGPEAPSALVAVNNLGNLYVGQGKLDMAAEMYMPALYGKEEALRAMHTSTLQTINNLSLLYADQGKLKEAEK